MNEVNSAVIQLYRMAKANLREPPGSVALARALWGDECIRLVSNAPRKGLLGGSLRYPIGYISSGLCARELNHVMGRLVSLWWLKSNVMDYCPEVLGKFTAALCVPESAFYNVRDRLGSDRGALCRAFCVSESLLALRSAECLGTPTALITPKVVITRGTTYPWPSTEDGWTELVAARRALVEPIRDAPDRHVVTIESPARYAA